MLGIIILLLIISIPLVGLLLYILTDSKRYNPKPLIKRLVDKISDFSEDIKMEFQILREKELN